MFLLQAPFTRVEHESPLCCCHCWVKLSGRGCQEANTTNMHTGGCWQDFEDRGHFVTSGHSAPVCGPWSQHPQVWWEGSGRIAGQVLVTFLLGLVGSAHNIARSCYSFHLGDMSDAVLLEPVVPFLHSGSKRSHCQFSKGSSCLGLLWTDIIFKFYTSSFSCFLETSHLPVQRCRFSPPHSPGGWLVTPLPSVSSLLVQAKHSQSPRHSGDQPLLVTVGRWPVSSWVFGTHHCVSLLQFSFFNALDNTESILCASVFIARCSSSSSLALCRCIC